MQSNEILRAICEDAGIPMSRASVLSGRSALFIARYLSESKSPGTNVLAEICNATNHDLLVRNRTTGREIVIDPPERSDDE